MEVRKGDLDKALQGQLALISSNPEESVLSCLFVVQLRLLQAGSHEGLVEVLLVHDARPHVLSAQELEVGVRDVLHVAHALRLFVDGQDQVDEHRAEALRAAEGLAAKQSELHVHVVDHPVALCRQFAWVHRAQRRLVPLKEP